MADLATLNQVIQLGVEVTPGTSPGGGAARLLTNLTVNIDPTFDYTMYRGSGRRHPSLQSLVKDWASWKWGGPVTYMELAYPFSGLWGLPVVTTPTNGVNARQLTWSTKLTGNQGGVTYLFQNGDTNRARQWNFGQTTGVELTLNRSGGADITGGGGIAQQTQNNITMTASPVALAPKAAPPVNFNAYLDLTSAGIGTTLLGRCFSAKFAYDNAYAPLWVLNRSQASFSGVVDTAPKALVTLQIMPDSTTDNYWPAARAGSTAYIRLQGIGNPVDNAYSLNGSASYTSGTFTLSYKGATTSAIAFNASGTTILGALNALATVTTPWTCSQSATLFNTANTFIFTAAGTLANDPSPLTAAFSLTGGSPAITSLVVNNELHIDLAAKYVPKAYNDMGGAWVQDWDFEIVEDTAWTLAGASGTAIYAYLVNTMTAL